MKGQFCSEFVLIPALILLSFSPFPFFYLILLKFSTPYPRSLVAMFIFFNI